MEWISVKERLPRKRAWALIRMLDDTYFVGFCDDSKKRWIPSLGIAYIDVSSSSHWTYLPEPPKEKK